MIISHGTSVIVIYKHEKDYEALAPWLTARTQIFPLDNGLVCLMEPETFDALAATFNLYDGKQKPIWPGTIRSKHTRSTK